MKKWSLRLLKLAYAGLILSLPIYALADYNATQGSGTIFRAFDATHGGTSACAVASTQCQAVGLVNSAGTEIGTSGVPIRIDPTGTTTQPVNVGQYAGAAVTAVPTAYGTAPTGNVIGVNASVTNANPNGQATMANSSPVVIASNQSNVPINVAQVNGVTVPVGSGVQATAERFTLATDSPGIVALGPATAANSVPMTIGPILLGSYCMGANTGTMAAGLAGGSPIYSFRYGGANLAIVRKVSAEADDITTAFVAGAGKLDLFAARSFSASDTGGTAGTLTGNNGKLRTSFATTAISDLRISSTATLTAGTRTLDAQPLATVEFTVSTSIDGGLLPTTDLIRQNVGESPLVLANNEGFVIQATVPGTGTWVAAVRVCWDETTVF